MQIGPHQKTVRESLNRQGMYMREGCVGDNKTSEKMVTQKTVPLEVFFHAVHAL